MAVYFKKFSHIMLRVKLMILNYKDGLDTSKKYESTHVIFICILYIFIKG